jgi:4-hydroxybenzoate polyprenyltransferase
LRQRRQAQQRWHHVLRKHQVPINSFQRFVMVSLCLSFLCLSHSLCISLWLSFFHFVLSLGTAVSLSLYPILLRMFIFHYHYLTYSFYMTVIINW